MLQDFYKEQDEVAISPDEISKIYFLPTHSLELVEAAALKEATEIKLIESREPRILCYDVLIQYLSTLAISDGFNPDEIFKEIKINILL